MKALKVVYAVETHLYEQSIPGWELEAPVVRLAEVDELISLMVKFAENVTRNGRWQEQEWYHAQEVLDSPLVKAWRKRQEKGGHHDPH